MKMVLLVVNIPLDIKTQVTIETEILSYKEDQGDGIYIFIFLENNNDDPGLVIPHNFDSGDTFEDEPYEEVQFKIPIFPEPEGGGKEKREKQRKDVVKISHSLML